MPPKNLLMLAVTSATVIAAGTLATLAACANESATGGLMTSVSVEDARDLLTEAGTHVEKVEFVPDGFVVTAAISPEQHVWFDGMNCKGAAETMTCTEFKIAASWEFDTPAHASASAKQLNYNYTSVFADGSKLSLWRMDFVYGGITRDHLRQTVLEFLDLRRQAANVIWPPTNSATPATPKLP